MPCKYLIVSVDIVRTSPNQAHIPARYQNVSSETAENVATVLILRELATFMILYLLIYYFISASVESIPVINHVCVCVCKHWLEHHK